MFLTIIRIMNIKKVFLCIQVMTLFISMSACALRDSANTLFLKTDNRFVSYTPMICTNDYLIEFHNVSIINNSDREKDGKLKIIYEITNSYRYGNKKHKKDKELELSNTMFKLTCDEDCIKQDVIQTDESPIITDIIQAGEKHKGTLTFPIQNKHKKWILSFDPNKVDRQSIRTTIARK